MNTLLIFIVIQNVSIPFINISLNLYILSDIMILNLKT
jgi:hypothetical protein